MKKDYGEFDRYWKEFSQGSKLLKTQREILPMQKKINKLKDELKINSIL